MEIEITDADLNVILKVLADERDRCAAASITTRVAELSNIINRLHLGRRPASRPTKLMEEGKPHAVESK